MRIWCLDAVDAVIKAVRDVLANQLVIVFPVEEAFTSTDSTPAALILAPQVILLMRVSQHIHSVDQNQLAYIY